jgi:hypothetical protein
MMPVSALRISRNAEFKSQDTPSRSSLVLLKIKSLYSYIYGREMLAEDM